MKSSIKISNGKNPEATTAELESALVTFIKSGSSNGREDLRDKCLKMVPLIVKAVNERAALEAVVEAADAVVLAAKDSISSHREHAEPCNCTDCSLFDAIAKLESIRNAK